MPRKIGFSPAIVNKGRCQNITVPFLFVTVCANFRPRICGFQFLRQHFYHLVSAFMRSFMIMGIFLFVNVNEVSLVHIFINRLSPLYILLRYCRPRVIL